MRTSEGWEKSFIIDRARPWTDARLDEAFDRGEEWAKEDAYWEARTKNRDRDIVALNRDLLAGKLNRTDRRGGLDQWKLIQARNKITDRMRGAKEVLDEVQGVAERTPADTPERMLVDSYYDMVKSIGQMQQFSFDMRENFIAGWLSQNADPETPEGAYLLRNINATERMPFPLFRALIQVDDARTRQTMAAFGPKVRHLVENYGADTAVEYVKWFHMDDIPDGLAQQTVAMLAPQAAPTQSTRGPIAPTQGARGPVAPRGPTAPRGPIAPASQPQSGRGPLAPALR